MEAIFYVLIKKYSLDCQSKDIQGVVKEMMHSFRLIYNSITNYYGTILKVIADSMFLLLSKKSENIYYLSLFNISAK